MLDLTEYKAGADRSNSGDAGFVYAGKTTDNPAVYFANSAKLFCGLIFLLRLTH